MVVRWQKGSTTFEGFLGSSPPDQKADLIDGVIYPVSPENIDHNDLVFWLGSILRIFVEHRNLGRVTINRVAFRLSADTAPEPDLAFVRKERLGLLERGFVDGPPDLAIEVMSPESAFRDTDLKRARYEQFGVSKYWLIDPQEESATFLVLGSDHPKEYAESLCEGTIYRSKVLPGFWIDTKWFWEHPRPSVLPIVQSMLGD